MSKRLNKMKTDKETRDILDQDLSDYINKENFKEIHFDLQPKDKSVTLRISSQLLEAFKKRANQEGVDYQKLIRKALENFLKKSAS